MLRQGGWAVPLNCSQPRWQVLAGSAAERDAALCAALPTLPGACSRPLAAALDALCDSGQSPLLLGIRLAVLALLVVLLGWLLTVEAHRWLGRGRRSAAVALAARAAAEVRATHSAVYPPSQHSWARERGAVDMAAYCYACFQPVHPNVEAAVCEVCGVLCHESCAKTVQRDCQPLACELLLHSWRPAAAVQHTEQGEGEGADVALQVCLYCGQPCEVGPFANEPVWSCTGCRAVAHCACYLDRHPGCFSTKVAAALRNAELAHIATLGVAEGAGSMGSDGAASPSMGSMQGGAWLSAGAPAARAAAAAGGAVKRRKGARRGKGARGDAGSSGNGAEGGGVRQGGMRHTPLADGGAGAALHSGGTLPPPSRLRGKRALSMADRLSEVGEGGLAASPPPPVSGLFSSRLAAPGGSSARMIQLPAGHNSHGTELLDVDVCGLGRHWRMVLPPTCVLPAKRGGTQPTAAAASGSGDAPASGGGSKRQRMAGAEAQAGTQAAGGGGGAAAKRSSWWSGRRSIWEEYTIDRVPLGCRPLLVFLNSRSGPQQGQTLRRNFLRLLHPLQVVELPKQSPGPALACFAHVASLRVLVVGGDGTVGWVLRCLDELQARQAAEGRGGWRPPPVAVLPLGTGNDLARMLNWGGGLKAAWQHSVAGVLEAVEVAGCALLDRWDVRCTPTPPPAPPGARGQGARGVLGVGGRVKEAAPQEFVMNNYLGIGIDAKIALDFHQLRDSFPEWFRSQMGNKLWYTGVGAASVIEGACSNLPSKVQLELDGREVALPPRLEGLLLLNIASYMGGCNLWASSVRAPLPRRGQDGPRYGDVREEEGPWGGSGGEGWDSGGGEGWDSGGGGGGDDETVAAQDMADGVLEVVGVYGVWHLGQLQVGLNRAVRLGQCRRATITTSETLPMQVDGEPQLQPPATIHVSLRGKALMMRRVDSPPVARMLAALHDVLDDVTQRGVISQGQRHTITAEVAARVNPLL